MSDRSIERAKFCDSLNNVIPDVLCLVSVCVCVCVCLFGMEWNMVMRENIYSVRIDMIMM